MKGTMRDKLPYHKHEHMSAPIKYTPGKKLSTPGKTLDLP